MEQWIFCSQRKHWIYFCDNCQSRAMLLQSQAGTGNTDASGKLDWHGMGYIMPNSANGGMSMLWIAGIGTAGLMSAKNGRAMGSGNLAGLQFNGTWGTAPTTFSQLPTCAARLEGYSDNVVNLSHK
jgi:hypothetical protein